MKLYLPISERTCLIKYVLSFAGATVLWAVLHDIHLIQVEPRHFTEFHRQLLPLANPILLAMQYATIATLGPGLAFGFMAFAACRLGQGAKTSLTAALGGFLAVILLIEALVLWAGQYSQASVLAGLPPFYPVSFYPEMTPGIVYTQSVNISAYLLGPSLGAFYLAGLYFTRTQPNDRKIKSCN